MAALRGLMLAIFAAIGAGGADRLAPGAPAAQPDAFSLELSSWGNPVLSWRIGSDGRGEYRSAEHVPGGGFGDYDVSTRRFEAGPAGFRQVRAIMDDVARRAPAELPCRQRIYDAPYGEVRWHRGAAVASLAFNFGCRDALAQQVIERIGQATSLASSWSSSRPVVEVRHVRQGAQR